MAAPRKYPDGLRERAVRTAVDARKDRATRRGCWPGSAGLADAQVRAPRGQGLGLSHPVVDDGEEPQKIKHLDEQTRLSRHKLGRRVAARAGRDGYRQRAARESDADDRGRAEAGEDDVAEAPGEDDESRVDMMRAYAETLSCRRQYLPLLQRDARATVRKTATPASPGAAARHRPVTAGADRPLVTGH